MKNGRCPQCAATTVHSQPSGVQFGNMDRVFVEYGKSHQPSRYTTYLCTTCGYFENYLTSADFIAQAASTWPAVPVKG